MKRPQNSQKSAKMCITIASGKLLLIKCCTLLLELCHWYDWLSYAPRWIPRGVRWDFTCEPLLLPHHTNLLLTGYGSAERWAANLWQLSSKKSPPSLEEQNRWLRTWNLNIKIFLLKLLFYYYYYLLLLSLLCCYFSTQFLTKKSNETSQKKTSQIETSLSH